MKSFNITSHFDNLSLACLMAEPEQKSEIKGIVQLVHGMCEHKERYIPFMEFLAGNGYVCIIHDHRGHGESVRSRDDLGYMGIDGWKGLVEDTKDVSDYVKGLFPGLKLYLFGHSMGSMVVRSYIKRYDDKVDMLFVSGCPSDNPAKGVGKILALLSGIVRGWHYRPMLLQKMSFGAYNKPFAAEKFHSAWVCSDKDVLEAYHNDSLCQFVFTSDGFYNLLKLMEDCYSDKGWAVRNPSLPIHFLSGGMDPCRINDTELNKAVSLIKTLGYVNTDLVIYPGMRHEILNESDKQKVWNDILLKFLLHTK